jgi:hypothetical protein
MKEPLAEIARVLDELGDADPDRRELLLEEGGRAATNVRKTNDELSGLLGAARGHTGAARTRPDGFDPAAVIDSVAGRLVASFAEAGVALEVRVPPLLPSVRGRQELLVEALTGLLRARLAVTDAGSSVVVSVKLLDRGDAPSVIVAVLDPQGTGQTGEAEPEAVVRAVQALGGDIRTTADAATGRVTGIRLPAMKP